jgi:hypothetical protein
MRRLLLAALLFLPALESARGLAARVREARTYRAAPATRVPGTGPVDIIILTPAARERAVFLGAELAPRRDVRFFDSREAWRARRRAVFMHDRRAANAPPGPPPGPAEVVLELR